MRVVKALRVSLVVLSMGAAGAAVGQTPRGAADETGKREAVLEARLEAEEALAGRALDARVEGKTKVILTGVVKSEEDKALAERVVKRAGYPRVDNLVTVDPAVAPPATAAPAATDAATERRALSDPQRRDPVVGSKPFEQTPTREERLRSMGMEDPKLGKQREEAAKARKAADATMAPTEAPAAGSDHPQTGNQSAPPKKPPATER